MIHDSILDTIGRTPVVRINRLAPAGIANVRENRGIQSRCPRSRTAWRTPSSWTPRQSGALKPGQMVVEATSGNTGIALAMVCAAKGYPFVAFMVETFSIERRKLMRALGAKVIADSRRPSAAAAWSSGPRNSRRKHGAFLARQFDNPANPALPSGTLPDPKSSRTSPAAASTGS